MLAALESVVLASLAFIALTLIGIGLFGRPDQGKPLCRSCKRDARELAWDDVPTCPCGARLDAPGAVRTRGRVRRPRLVVVGLVIALADVALLLWTIPLARRHLNWVDGLPSFIVRYGLEHDAEWAIESIGRRARAETLRPVDLGWLLPALAANRSLTLRSLGPSGDRLMGQWIEHPVNVDAVLPIIAAVDAFDSTQLLGGNDPSTLFIGITQSPTVDEGRWLVRVEGVELDGAAVPFVVQPFDLPQGEWWPAPGDRVIVGRGACSIAVPQSGQGKSATVVLDLTIARTLAAKAAPHDPIIDSAAPPEAWGVPVLTTRVRRTITATPAGAAGP
jgi:hypothetical protein